MENIGITLHGLFDSSFRVSLLLCKKLCLIGRANFQKVLTKIACSLDGDASFEVVRGKNWQNWGKVNSRKDCLDNPAPPALVHHLVLLEGAHLEDKVRIEELKSHPPLVFFKGCLQDGDQVLAFFESVENVSISMKRAHLPFEIDGQGGAVLVRGASLQEQVFVFTEPQNVNVPFFRKVYIPQRAIPCQKGQEPCVNWKDNAPKEDKLAKGKVLMQNGCQAIGPTFQFMGNRK